MPQYYNCAQVAEKYLVKTLTVWSWIRKKKLNAKRIGKQYLISDEDLRQFEAKNKKES